jgi:uroporphyrinogen-III synthase
MLVEWSYMKAKVVAILETRAGAHLAELIQRRGGVPMLAPALQEVPDVDPQVVQSLLEEWRREPFQCCIFQTGVGTRALFSATDTAGSTRELKRLLADSIVAVRGPKPTAELNARQVRIDLKAPSPFTTDTLLTVLSDLSLSNARILVQRYGATNQELASGLQARGARVQEIATYRWALPTNAQPLIDVLNAIATGKVDVVVFTSAVQMHNLYAVAEKMGNSQQLAGQLNRTIVASIGPVCSRALRSYGVNPQLEADPPKLGPLMAALDAVLSAG